MKNKQVIIISFITVLTLLFTSCNQKEPIEVDIKTSSKAILETSTEDTDVVLNNLKTWEEFINGCILKHDLKSLYTQKDSEINLSEYVEQGKIIFDGDSSEKDILINDNVDAFLIDLNKDGIEDLYLVQCEGSIRHYYVNVYEKKDDVYVDTSKNMTDGYIFPIRYNSEVHFLEIVHDFQTKFTSAIIEYEFNGSVFEQKNIIHIDYSYDMSQLPESITNIIDSEYLYSLNSYEISDSNIAEINNITSQPSCDIILDDKKNNNIFNFKVELWLTSVGYAPNQWEIEANDESTSLFDGTEHMITNRNEGTDENVCFGLKFWKDEDDTIYLLKVSYPFFTMDDRIDGELILQLFMFNMDSVEEVETIRIEPTIEINNENVMID